MTDGQTIRLLVADALLLVRAGVRRMLQGSNIQVVAEASDQNEAVVLAVNARPDVVLVDISLPPTSGLQAISAIKAVRPELAVILYLNLDHSAYVAKSVSLGANGCLPKSCAAEQLTGAIITVASGRDLWSREDLRRISGSLSTFLSHDGQAVPLTRRETEVLKYVVDGETNNQIAERLGISHETVKEHVQHILQKVGLRDRTQVAVWAVRNGLA